MGGDFVLGRGWGLKSPHTLPPKGKGPEEKTRHRKGVISLAQVGGWGIASQPKYPFHNANMHEGKLSRRGPC